MSAETTPSPPGRERDVFLGALEQASAADRALYLDEACAGDPALRSRVEDLLREQEAVGGFLETPALGETGRPAPPALGPGGTAIVETSTEKPGDRIGRYKLLQKIGEGGIGVVYMAEQEESVRRRVALKVIKLGMDTRNVIARFEAERQALAMMDHPNIARVLDAGATELGRPFFVMELVRGVKITDYCDENHLPTEERLELFIRVCHAIQHAHQKGIIHRDIKPSNILVTLHDGVPVPKVIDFGIAKATEHRLTEKTLFTEFTAFIGTPAYMSPEQAQMSGLDIDTRSDIYSLGVLLYELLTGRTPFDAETLVRGGLDECRRTIREQEPARPSTRVATLVEAELTTTARQRRTASPQLIHLLRGDLDWIAMKCLEKDRTRRYATAQDLAADVQRYLDGEPILARPPSNLYRFRKFARRHRGAFGAAAAVAAALLAGAGLSAWLAVRATRAERDARALQRQEAQLRHQAERQEAAARLNEYVADINLAKQSLDAGNYGRAVQLLDKHRPQPGEPDLRGFEWRYLWQVSRGDEHLAFPTQAGAVQSVALSPNGELLVVGLHDRFTVYHARTRAVITSVARGAGSMAFLPDAKTLITAGTAGFAGGLDREPTRGPPSGGRPPGSAERPPASPGAMPGREPPGRPSTQPVVRVWNTADWTERTALSQAAGPIAVSPDGTRLAAAREGRGWDLSREGVRVWDTATWSERLFLTNAFGPMAFAADGRALVTDSRAGLTVWPVDGTGAELVLTNSTNVFVRGGPGFPWARSDRVLAFSPDGKSVVAPRNMPSDHGVFVLGIWDLASGAEAAMPKDPEHTEHTGAIAALAFSPDGRLLATASWDYSIRLWDWRTRQPVAVLHGHSSEVMTLAFSPDGQSLVSGAKDGSVKLWPVRPQPKEDLLAGFWQPPLAFARDGQRLAVLRQGAQRQTSVVFLNATTRQVEQELPLAGPSERGRFRLAPAFSDDLKTLAQALEDGRVQLWNTETRETATLEVAPGNRPLSLLALSPDGRLLLSGGFGHALRCWDVRAGTNAILESEAYRVLFSPDGRVLAGFRRGDTVELWDLTTRSLRTNLVSEVSLRYDLTVAGSPAAAFSPDGRLLAIACSDDTVRLWDAATCEPLGTFAGHKQAVSSLAFAPDGKTLATASDDNTLKFWNVATQQELLTLRRLGGALRTVLFSPDGRLLVGRISSSLSTGGLRFYRAAQFAETDAAPAPAEHSLSPP